MYHIIKKPLLVCFALLIAGAGCGKKEEEAPVIPDNILTEERFVKVLADFALAEGAANMNINTVPVQKIDSVYAFNPLLENNVRPSQYDSTLRFYAQNPELYRRVYENVLVNLTAMQSKKASQKKDSLPQK